MYEPEVNKITESLDTIPASIRARFGEWCDRIVARTVLPWGEHCTECVWPTCYTTCELYSPRIDGACRQFIDGMVRIDNEDGLSPYLLKIRFKQWAKLWTVGNLHLTPLSEARSQERLHIAIGAIGRNAPLPASIKPRLLTKINYLRRVAAQKARSTEHSPDYFLLECYNPGIEEVGLTLTVRPVNGEKRSFGTRVRLPRGYSRSKVTIGEICSFVDLAQPFEIEMVPNASDQAVLYFGLIDFVQERRAASLEASPASRQDSRWKCIVWDLDNTVWDGILLESGRESLRLRPGVLDVIRRTDERGILHSIASKNNREDAMEALQSLGIGDYFLYPQISWEPKSVAVARIAQQLNIGLDTIAFVDDQPFERDEVRSALPEVTLIDAANAANIPDRPQCDVPVSAESARRRAMYRQQEQRQGAVALFQGDYLGFLRSCDITVRVSPLGETTLRRVYELAQRTNQLNFTGNRYNEQKLAEIAAEQHLDALVMECVDRFGSYGIVGFGIVDRSVPRLQDLMFSCRVQGKRVEHAVLAFLLKRFGVGEGRDFYADYRLTSKNAAAGQVFSEMGFERVSETAGLTCLVFKGGGDVPDDRIIQISADLAGDVQNVNAGYPQPLLATSCGQP